MISVCLCGEEMENGLENIRTEASKHMKRCRVS